jgi:hypothetical protein
MEPRTYDASRARFGLAGAVALVAAAAACSGGLSQGDADLRCNQEQEAKTACFDANVYQLCQSCYERCGDACVPQGLCPEQYLCPGDHLLDAGSNAL